MAKSPQIPKRKIPKQVSMGPSQSRVSPLIQRGFALHQEGKLEEARAIYEEILKLEPTHFDALQLLGLLLAQTKQFIKAVDFFDRALAINPDHADCYSNRGVALKQLKKFDQALASYDKAISLRPDYADAHSNRGVTLQVLSRYKEALASCEKAISLKPDHADAYFNRGNALQALKRYDEALASYDKAISIKPDYADVHSNRGVTLQALKRYDEALASYDKAIRIKPDFADTYSNRGNALQALNRYHEALASCDKAISINPDHADAHSNRGNALQALKYFDEALASCDKAISIESLHIDAHFNRGNALLALKRYEEALACYDRVNSIRPDYADAFLNRGAVLQKLKRYDEAIICYDKAIGLKPELDWASGELLFMKMRMCSWTGLADSLEQISKKVVATEKVIQPFALLSVLDNASLHKKSSEIYSQAKFPVNPALGSIPKSIKSEKIRIGYFSADFGNHPVSLLTAELFELHDRGRFEIVAFSFGGNNLSPMRLRLSQAFNQFIDVSELSELNIAKLSRELHIDIAVDLGGYTTDNRAGIFAYRTAPIQLSYIGYLGTLGAEYFDYLIADKTIIPKGSESDFSEKIAYLPSYQANDRKRVISDRIFTRKELGLPEAGFVFCCFNNNFKITPDTFASWMRILQAVEGSILFLYSENLWAETNLKMFAKEAGIDISRIIFGTHSPTDQYLARYRTCDLFLDTTPYNAGTTASDALWTGLPVLTLIGQSFASRVAASLLRAIDLPELITHTREEYEALAIELATQPHKLAAIKQKLSENRLTTPLFDTPRFTKHLEAAYTQMMERYWADLPPEHIDVRA